MLICKKEFLAWKKNNLKKLFFFMKTKFLLLLPLLSVYSVSAQLTVTSGAEFFVNGDIPLTLKNTDLINNGILAGGINPTFFTGDASSSISGSGSLRLFQLQVNKTGNQSVILQKSIDVVNSVVFTSGFLDLNGFNIDLETTGRLDGEQENSRIRGTNGGQVLFRTVLNAPAGANPGNLGAVITSGQDLGNVTIKRGHQSQVNGSGIGTSILRYYDISPTNNTNLNATLRFNYFDAELNNLDESSLVLFKSENTTNWLNQGFTSRNTTGNFVEKTGISSFSRWTLSNVNNPLPVQFILFNVKCEGNKVVVTWKTAQEQNSSRFDIERSSDGIRWTVIGNLPAAGNSITERSYSFTDTSPVQNSYYRIAEYDLDGRVQYTSQLRSSCNTTDAFSLWPNPFHDLLFINIVAGNESQAMIKIFDSKGALVKVQRAIVLQGSNQLNVNMNSMASGVYQLLIDWNNGQTRKTVQILKQ
jgi:Secretion system C-terminal sorting domain